MHLAKVVFLVTLFLVLTLSAFGYGLYSAETRNEVYAAVMVEVEEINRAFQDVDETAIFEPMTFLQPSRRSGEGVTIDQAPDRDSLIFLTSFFDGNNELRLMRRDGTPVARWPLKFSEIFPGREGGEDAPSTNWDPATDWNADLHGSLINSDGSVVFNFEYAGLVKLDHCGGVLWTLNHPTHHSVERSERGGYWVPGRRHYSIGTDSPFPPFKPPLAEDLVLRVSEEGEVLEEISLPAVMRDGGLWPLLTANGHEIRDHEFYDYELVHLNKIGELSTELAPLFPQFEAGDLIVSVKFLNAVFVFSPETGEIKWTSVGPWLRQHDPEFASDGRILVFNNNTFLGDLDNMYRPRRDREMVSNIIAIDPKTNAWEVVYGEREGEDFLTVIRGKVDETASGGLFITEFEGGRVIETDAEGQIVWEFINRYDDDEVVEISEARLIGPGYFDAVDWTCGGSAE